MAKIDLSRHDWLSFVDRSGLLISEPVLLNYFPGGPDKLAPWQNRKFHKQFQRRFLSGDPAARQREWLDFILIHILNLTGRVAGANVPDSCCVYLMEYDQKLRADWALLDESGKPIFLGMTVAPDQPLERRETKTGRWKATPVTKMERLLSDTGVPLGLLTNGEDFRLVYAPAGLTPGAITFTAQTFADEKTTLDAFYTLLNGERFYGDEPKRLLAMARESQDRQVDVADQLGRQVREALEVFVRALDDADTATDGKLLSGMDDVLLYEMSLTVMMRMVFLLYAEENRLLPHGEALYDNAYGITHLWTELEDDRKAERLDAADAWPRFLATCRLLYEGCLHPDLRMPAYGGRLFDPQRFPVLEDPRFALANRTLYEMLRRLLHAWGKIGGEKMRQRVSYRTLGVEQIGYVYEGLLDHRIGRAKSSPRLRLAGDKEPEIDLAQLSGKSRAEQVKILATAMDKKPREFDKIENKLDTVEDPVGGPFLARLPENLDPAIAEQVRPFANLLRPGGVVEPHRRYVAMGQSRRISGSHYTPQTLTSDIVRHTLEPLVYENDHGVYKRMKAEGGRMKGGEEGARILKSPREILDLKVCDMAMGSGAFLVQAVRYLADRLVESWEQEMNSPQRRQGREENSGKDSHTSRSLGFGGDVVAFALPYAEPSDDPGKDRLIPEDIDEQKMWARRYVALRCIYGVDKNPLAVEMGKLSLWLTTLAKDKPFTFLDHALKCGDSLVGVDREQLETWSFDREGGGRQVSTIGFVVRRAVSHAIRKRRELTEAPVDTAGQQKEKEKLLFESDRAMAIVKAAGDVLVASHFGEENGKKRNELRKRLGDKLQVLLVGYDTQTGKWAGEELEKECLTKARELAKAHLDEERPFHWPFEFPEVFLDGERKGFDAFIGNPPFMGGQKITGAFGVPYRDYLVDIISSGRKGSADLCSYFYLATYGRLNPEGSMGLIATNTIGQGDTREIGLAHLVGNGASIIGAISGMPWPGKAGVHVSVVHLHHGTWKGGRLLDEKPVRFISPLLDSSSAWQPPHRLKQNEGKSFQGSIILGLGFTMEPEEAQRLIAKNRKNKEVLFPYLNGQDLNTHPEQQAERWVINFSDWPLEKCEEGWLELMKHLRETVKPKRDTDNRKSYRDWWWHYAEKRPALYKAIEGMERVLVTCLVTKHWSVSWLPTGWIYSHATGVFTSEEKGLFACLQSSPHELWSRGKSSLETRMRYTPSDCFETFPFPQNLTANIKDLLEKIGETYHEHRRQVMKDRWIGLTKTYNLFHDPACRDADIEKLRKLHVEMDNAVLAAYGWEEIDLGHDFREAQWLPGADRLRFTLTAEAREEIIERLLALNHEIAEKEAKGAKEGKITAKAQRAQSKGRKDSGQGRLL